MSEDMKSKSVWKMSEPAQTPTDCQRKVAGKVKTYPGVQFRLPSRTLSVTNLTAIDNEAMQVRSSIILHVPHQILSSGILTPSLSSRLPSFPSLPLQLGQRKGLEQINRILRLMDFPRRDANIEISRARPAYLLPRC